MARSSPVPAAAARPLAAALAVLAASAWAPGAVAEGLSLVVRDDGHRHHHHGHHKHHRGHHQAAHGGQQPSHQPRSLAAADAGAVPVVAANVSQEAEALKPAAAAAAAAAAANSSSKAEPAVASPPPQAPKAAVQTDEQLAATLKRLDEELSAKEAAKAAARTKGQLALNGPLPSNFAEAFAREVAAATGSKAEDVRVLGSAEEPRRGTGGPVVDDVVFEAQPEVVDAVRQQAADSSSRLASGPLRSLLVAKSEASDGDDDDEEEDAGIAAAPASSASGVEAPEIDSSAMPFGDLEPFGRENTASQLTDASIRESDAMVDQLERAEVAEEKRSVFRALTRLRGAAITSFDGVARSQTGNIDEYARKNQWRKSHPVRHLAQEESDTQRWAFPESSDF